MHNLSHNTGIRAAAGNPLSTAGGAIDLHKQAVFFDVYPAFGYAKAERVTAKQGERFAALFDDKEACRPANLLPALFLNPLFAEAWQSLLPQFYSAIGGSFVIAHY